MQYKIPVQIENEDPIVLGLSLRQLIILMVGFSFAYLIFSTLEENTWFEIAIIPSGGVAIITVLIAVFKQYEMTFIPFILALILLNSFPKQRLWSQWVDSFQSIDIGFIPINQAKKNNSIDLTQKQDTIKEFQEKLKKI